MKLSMLILLLVLLSAAPALAHKVNLFAYVEGGVVYTESYFPDGSPVAGGKVLVYDSQKRLVLEGATDRKGLFHFVIPTLDDLKIVVEASMGHHNSYRLKREDLEAGR
ncbi:MAG: carboxypeptidase regulatory-like domain-containing protein [Trichloromonadaceae bacterium]